MNPIIQNILGLIITFVIILIWLRLIDFIAHKGWVDSRTSRKIIHIGTGPIFVLCWLLFTSDSYVRYLAALVPLMITVQFALVGLGKIKDEAAVQALSRTGDPREILYGPLYYGLVFVLLTIIFWLHQPAGIIALMLLCGGDGLAEILGRRFGRARLPWNHEKSWLGSLSFFLGGWLLCIFVFWAYQLAGVFPDFLTAHMFTLALIALAATLVESITPHNLDNLTVPAVAVVLGLLFF